MAHSPEECERRFAECVRAGDLDNLLALYEPGARLLQRDGTVASGHAEIRRVLATLTSTPTTIDMHVLTAIQAGDLAVLYNDWHIQSVGGDGTLTRRAGKAIEIVRRQPDGRWLFVIDDPFGRGRGSG